MLQRLAQALNAGDRTTAGAILAQLRRQQPDDPNVLLFGAILDRQEGRLDESIAALRRLHALAPRHPAIRFQLANSLKDRGLRDEGVALYRGLLAEQPTHADAAFNLALCLAEREPEEAGRWFLLSGQCNPLMAEAHQGAIDCAARLAKAGRSPPADVSHSIERVAASISIICCSIDPARLARLRDNLEQILASEDWELVVIHDARSLCEGYNRGLRQTRGELVVLCHDDIVIHAHDFAARLAAHLQRHDVIGVAGSTRCCGPAAYWSGPPHIHGWVVYRDDRQWLPSISSSFGPVVEQAQVLDGLFIAARRQVFELVQFDEQSFDRFHLYDIDFSWRAHRAGLKLAICQDLLVEHASMGRFDREWQGQADRFLAKFPDLPREPASRSPSIFRAAVDEAPQIPTTYAWISQWLTEIRESAADSPAAIERSGNP